jgi:hypothetical protein
MEHFNFISYSTMIKIVISVQAGNIRDAHMDSNNNFVFIFQRVLVGIWNSGSGINLYPDFIRKRGTRYRIRLFTLMRIRIHIK